MPWYWIGTKKCLNDMEWLQQVEYTIHICIEIELDIRKSTKKFASLNNSQNPGNADRIGVSGVF